jgi:hypothetical protein
MHEFSWGYSSAGRAPALQAGGRRFESVYLHHLIFLDSSAVEHPAVNRRVVGSNPTRGANHAPIAQSAERIHGKDEVTSSNLVGSSTFRAFSSAGRAPALQAGGRRFEPVNAHHCLWSDGRVGRRRSPAKRVYGQKPYRRFESVSLRQN